MALAITEEPPFRFFDLPPELRNMVYDNLKEWQDYPYKLGLDKAMWSPTIEGLPPHLRHISCQFLEEAEAQLSKSITLSLYDRMGPNDLDFPLLHADMICDTNETITRLAITLSAFCNQRNADTCPGYCRVHLDIRSHRDWITSMIEKLPNLKTVDIELDVEWPVAVEVCWSAVQHGPNFQDALDNLVQVPQLASLKVIACDFDLDTLSLIPNRGLWGTWEKESGWQAPEIKKLGPPVKQPLSKEGRRMEEGDDECRDDGDDEDEEDNE